MWADLRFNSVIYAIKCQEVVIELWLGSYLPCRAWEDIAISLAEISGDVILATMCFKAQPARGEGKPRRSVRKNEMNLCFLLKLDLRMCKNLIIFVFSLF